MRNLEEEYEYNLCFDEPIPYKNLKLYPVTIENYFNFHRWVGSILIDKDEIVDPEIMRMSYLKFLMCNSKKVDKKYEGRLYMFCLLLQLITRTNIFDKNEQVIRKKYKVEINGEEVELELPILDFGMDDSGNSYFVLDGFEYGPKDFEEIKRIVCIQNNIELDDDVSIDSKMKEKLEASLKFINKRSGEVVSLEHLLNCLSVSSGLDKKYIRTLTIRAFHGMLDSIDSMKNYEICRTGEASGMVTYKEPILHWRLKPKKKSKYESVMTDEKALRDKVEN